LRLLGLRSTENLIGMPTLRDHDATMDAQAGQAGAWWDRGQDIPTVRAKKSVRVATIPVDWLPVGHLVYLMLALVGGLDLSATWAYYERELRGRPPHDPRMTTTLLLYGYCAGITSSQPIERPPHEDVANRVDDHRGPERRVVQGPLGPIAQNPCRLGSL
jgi:hypothetical protein